jgi:CMP-N-acetylneuraminic acid synthetase
MPSDIVAIVPIKEHSERLPKKNFLDFNGRPLYHLILKTLGDVPEIDQVVVNTDAQEVIEEAPRYFDVKVSERPERLRDDEVTTRIIEYEVDRLDADIYMHTYCTSPLLRAETISNALQQFLESDEYDSILPVTRHQKRFYDAAFESINHDPHDISPTQDLPPVYEENSAMFIYNAETLQRAGRVGTDPLPIEIDEREAIEIDYRADFELAEALHARRYYDAGNE